MFGNFEKCDNQTRPSRRKGWARGILLLLAAAFLASGCQATLAQGLTIPSGSIPIDPHNLAAQVTGNPVTGQTALAASSDVSVTKTENGTVRVFGTMEGKRGLVNFDAEVSLPKEKDYPVYTALPFDINKDIDRDAWLNLAFEEEAKKAVPAKGIDHPKLDFRYEIPEKSFIGYDMTDAGFLFVNQLLSEPIYAAEFSKDEQEVRETPPGLNFTRDEAVTKAGEILLRYGIGEGFIPIDVKAFAYNKNTKGYYAVEWERVLSGLPVFRHRFFSTVGGTLDGESLSVSLSGEGIIKVGGTMHKFIGSPDRKTVIPLEKALKIFRENLDLTWTLPEQNGGKIPQKLDDIRLIYMPVPDPTAEKRDATIQKIYSPSDPNRPKAEEESIKPVTMVPVWYFSTKSDAQGGPRTISARSSAQYRTIINAINGEVIR